MSNVTRKRLIDNKLVRAGGWLIFIGWAASTLADSILGDLYTPPPELGNMATVLVGAVIATAAKELATGKKDDTDE